MIDLNSYLFRVHQAQGLTQSKVRTLVSETDDCPHTLPVRVSVHLWSHRHMHGSIFRREDIDRMGEDTDTEKKTM